MSDGAFGLHQPVPGYIEANAEGETGVFTHHCTNIGMTTCS